MRKYKDHLITSGSKVKDALFLLDKLSKDAILFVVDSEDKLLGSITDGDVEGLIKGFTVDSKIDEITQCNQNIFLNQDIDLKKIIEYREANYKILPVLDNKHKVVNIINFSYTKSYLPVDAVIMAGGRGQRLKPLTDSVPKPLLKIGDKEIIQHNFDRLSLFGISDFGFSVNYLGEQIQNHFGMLNNKNLGINYVWENNPLGTIGAVSKIDDFKHDYILVTNSDILTNLNYEKFFLEFIKKDADLAVLTIPYQVSIPYAVLETKNGSVKSFKKMLYLLFKWGYIFDKKINVNIYQKMFSMLLILCKN